MSYLGTKPANSPLTSELIPDGLINTNDLANSSVTVAKISATGTPSSSTFLRGDGGWQTVPTPVFSSQFSFPASNTALNWAHGLGSTPRQFGMYAVCTVSVSSVPVGTVFAMASGDGDGGRQTSVYANSTNVGFYGSNPIFRGFDGSNFQITSSNFNCYFWALL